RLAPSGLALIALATLAACEMSGAAPEARATEQGTGAPFVASTPIGSYLAGRHAQHQKDYAAAAGYYARALSSDPDDYDLMTRTLLLEVSDGRMKEAMPLASRIVSIEPNAAIAGLLLIADKMNSGDLAGAETLALALPRDGIHRFVAPLALA